MMSKWARNRSVFVLISTIAGWQLQAASAQADTEQRSEIQRLFQAGAYEQVVEAAAGADPASRYLAVQALLKLDRTEQALSELTELGASDQPVWRLIAESGEALVGNDARRAVDAARRASEADADQPFAFYQLGLSASKAGDWGTAARAFTSALDAKPDFAYAHYYAALVHQRQRQLPQAAAHFEAFLRLAPEAPERQAVQAIMRALK